jgi:hypothetical protein
LTGSFDPPYPFVSGAGKTNAIGKPPANEEFAVMSADAANHSSGILNWSFPSPIG